MSDDTYPVLWNGDYANKVGVIRLSPSAIDRVESELCGVNLGIANDTSGAKRLMYVSLVAMPARRLPFGGRKNLEGHILSVLARYGGQQIVAGGQMEKLVRDLADEIQASA